MLCVESPYTDVYFNLALEEYFMRNFSDDIFILYIDSPSVVIGKHQNALAEINLNYLVKNNITVARRLSGGGTVYHDLGNLNFSFISTSKDKNTVNFKKYQKPIVEALTDIGLKFEVGKRNDITINGLKISGNAEHIYKNRVLHHGTLLYNSNLEILSEAIKVKLPKYKDKAVQSKRSEVANISSFIDKTWSIDEFKSAVMRYVLNSDSSNIIYKLTVDDKMRTMELVDSKFSTWDWNFGYSPRYFFHNIEELADGKLEVKLFVEKGSIQNAEILLNGKSTKELNLLTDKLTGLRHYPDEISRLESNYNLISLLF